MKTHTGQTAAERIIQLEKEILELGVAIATGRAGKIHAMRAHRFATNSTLCGAKEWLDKLCDNVISDEVQRDYEDWKHGSTLLYAGFAVKRSTDFGIGGDPAPGKHGWVVVKDGCNPMPGATWARSMKGAQQLIDVYLAVGGDDLPPHDATKASREAHAKHGQRFWHLLRAIQAGVT